MSDPWTGFTQFTLLEEKPPDGYMWSRERLTRQPLTSRPDHPRPELWKSIGKHAKLKEKQKWSNEKLHLENARKLRGIYFIDPEDKEFKKTIKNAREKLETPLAPAVPCKIMRKNCGSAGSNKIKTKLACILEADESTRMRMGNSIPHNHEDHIAGKGPRYRRRSEFIDVVPLVFLVNSLPLLLSALLGRFRPLPSPEQCEELRLEALQFLGVVFGLRRERV